MADAERQVAEPNADVTTLEERFLEASRQADKARLRAARESRRHWMLLLALGFAAVVLILGSFAAFQWWKSYVLLTDLRIDSVMLHSDRGEIGTSFLWMARTLEALPVFKGGLEQVLRMQLSSWRDQLHELRERLPHEKPVWAVAFSSDGKTALTGSDDGTARLWDLTTKRKSAALVQGGQSDAWPSAATGEAP